VLLEFILKDLIKRDGRQKQNLSGWTGEPVSMGLSRRLQPQGDTMKHDEISEESQTQFTVYLHTVCNLIVWNLAIK
jgi:hypothetical protein